MFVGSGVTSTVGTSVFGGRGVGGTSVTVGRGRVGSGVRVGGSGGRVTSGGDVAVGSATVGSGVGVSSRLTSNNTARWVLPGPRCGGLPESVSVWGRINARVNTASPAQKMSQNIPSCCSLRADSACRAGC